MKISVYYVDVNVFSKSKESWNDAPSILKIKKWPFLGQNNLLQRMLTCQTNVVHIKQAILWILMKMFPHFLDFWDNALKRTYHRRMCPSNSDLHLLWYTFCLHVSLIWFITSFDQLIKRTRIFEFQVNIFIFCWSWWKSTAWISYFIIMWLWNP